VNDRTPTDSPLIGIKKAAERLGIHPETLRRWDRAGRITAYRTPTGIRRFKLADLDNFLERTA
jgi:excisionase family DNA binding protein